MTPLSTLIEQVRDGDEQAFAEIVSRFSEAAYHRAHRMTRDHHLAQGVVQEAFTEALLCLDGLREPAAFPGWFKRIVIKRGDRLIRGKRLDTVSLDHGLENIAHHSEEPYEDERAELSRNLRAGLELLPEHEREIAQQYYLASRSQRDIAEEFGLPVSTVKKRLYSSRQRLKKSLQDLDTPKDAPVVPPVSPVDYAFSAAWNGHASLVSRLIDEDPELLNKQNDDGLGLLLYAAHAAHCTGRSRVERVLLSKGAHIGIEEAAALGHTAHVREFVKDSSALVHARASWERTPLHWAASGGHDAVVDLLLDHNAQVNAQDRWGCTALHLAAELGHLSTVQLLLSRGADPGARLRNGKSVLQAAAPPSTCSKNCCATANASTSSRSLRSAGLKKRRRY